MDSREFDVRPLGQLPCCRAYAEAHGLGAEALCKSCADYRSYLHDVQHVDSEPYRPPAGFQHTPYWQVKGLKPPDWSKKKKKRKRGGEHDGEE